MKRFLLIILLLPSSLSFAIDEGDLVLHASGGWNQDLELFQGRAEVAYSFWDNFSMGPAVEYNDFFYAPGFGITWHLEPFELLTHAGPLFWRKDGEKRTSFHISIHANYLIQITTHFQLFVTAGVNLPEKYFRGVPLGAGMRYWF